MKKTARSQLKLVELALLVFHQLEDLIPVTAKTGLLPILKLTMSGWVGQFNVHAGEYPVRDRDHKMKKKINSRGAQTD